MTASQTLPWLEPLQARLRAAKADKRLPHAMVLQGTAGIGGDWLAQWLARLVLCDENNAPCGHCQNCTRLQRGQHPDCMTISPSEESKEIRIDQIRELIEDLSLTSHGSGAKIAIITPADRLNRNAANALLKTLEEPAANTLIILVAAQPGRLPPTIRSRCQRMVLSVPSESQCLAWLQDQVRETQAVPVAASVAWRGVLEVLGRQPLDVLSADAPAISAIASDTQEALERGIRGELDAVETAEKWSKTGYELRLRCIETWITKRLRNLGATQQLSSGSSALNIRALFELHDAVVELRLLMDVPLNRGMALERCLWRLPTLRLSA